ncbi:hypothetical protein OF83DRAFT_1086412 [Amylostereum chailletii]|nr:hypothetical protein OF83DRAFT_1086412 [Amylostereum chailletii]
MVVKDTKSKVISGARVVGMSPIHDVMEVISLACAAQEATQGGPPLCRRRLWQRRSRDGALSVVGLRLANCESTTTHPQCLGGYTRPQDWGDDFGIAAPKKKTAHSSSRLPLLAVGPVGKEYPGASSHRLIDSRKARPLTLKKPAANALCQPLRRQSRWRRGARGMESSTFSGIGRSSPRLRFRGMMHLAVFEIIAGPSGRRFGL